MNVTRAQHHAKTHSKDSRYLVQLWNYQIHSIVSHIALMAKQSLEPLIDYEILQLMI